MSKLNANSLKRLITIGRGDGIRAQLVRGGVGVSALQILFLPLSLIVTILLAQGLGTDGFGQYAFVISLITTLSIPLAPALMQLLTREAAALHNVGDTAGIRKLIHWANMYVLSMSAIVFLTLTTIFVLAVEWRQDARWILIAVGAMSLPLLGLTAVRSGILVGLRRVVWGQIPELLVRPTCVLGAVFILSVSGALSPLNAMISFVVGAASAFAVGSLLLRREYASCLTANTSETKATAKKWRRALVPFTLLIAANTMNAQIGVLLSGWLSTPDQVAAVRVAAQFSVLVALALSVINRVIGPHITLVYQSADRVQLQKLSYQSARLALLLALPFALPLILFARPILTLVLGVEFSDIAAVPLAILAAGQLINAGFGSVGMFLTMSGFERDTLIGQVIALVTNVIVAILLIPVLGAAGAAIAATLGLVTWNCILAVFVVARLKIRPGPI